MQRTAAQGVLTHDDSSANLADRAALDFELAHSSDDAALRRLMRENFMPGRVSLGLECEPSYFAALSIEGDRHHTIVARDSHSGHIIAMGNRSVRHVYVDGRVTKTGYLGHLRIDPAYRRRSRLRAEGFALARSTHLGNEACFDLTCIFADNRQARRLFTTGGRGTPKYAECDRVITLAISTHRCVKHSASTAVKIEAGSIRRLGEIAACLDRNNRRFQFASCWTVDDLVSSERSRGLRHDDFHVAVSSEKVVGVVARWDQRAFKQMVVRAYAPTLRRLRPFINLLSPLIRQPDLPAVGEPINSAYLSHFAIDDDEPAVALTLIESARLQARARGHDFLMLGLSARHPLLQTIRQTTTHHDCESILYIVNWTGDPDIVERFDGRVSHLEIATL